MMTLLTHHRHSSWHRCVSLMEDTGPRPLTAGGTSGRIATKRRKGIPDRLCHDLFTRQVRGLTQTSATLQELIDDAPRVNPWRNDRRKCDSARMEDLGDRLRRGASLILWDHHGDDDEGDQRLARAQSWRATLRDLGLDAVVVRGDRVRDDVSSIPTDAHITVLRLQDANLEAAGRDARRLQVPAHAVGFRLFGQATPLATARRNAGDTSRVADFRPVRSVDRVERLGPAGM